MFPRALTARSHSDPFRFLDRVTLVAGSLSGAAPPVPRQGWLQGHRKTVRHSLPEGPGGAPFRRGTPVCPQGCTSAHACRAALDPCGAFPLIVRDVLDSCQTYTFLFPVGFETVGRAVKKRFAGFALNADVGLTAYALSATIARQLLPSSPAEVRNREIVERGRSLSLHHHRPIL